MATDDEPQLIPHGQISTPEYWRKYPDLFDKHGNRRMPPGELWMPSTSKEFTESVRKVMEAYKDAGG